MKFDKPIRRLAPTFEVAPTELDTDTFRFVFSNEKRGRDGFVVLNRGIQHANYDLNPVVLFAHDDGQPPIGRGLNIDTSGADCTMDITFAPREINPFAGMIRDMVAGKWLRAVSLSWLPIKYKRSSDPDIEAIFTEVEMLECSVVPLPALPDALETARAQGIDTGPMYQWAERLLDTGEKTVVPRDELEQLRRAAKMTTKKPAGSDAGTGDGQERSAVKIKRAFTRSIAQPLFKRGLYDAGRLCFLLEELGYAHFSAAFEAELEGDGSAMPEMLKKILDDLGEACKAMTEEEVDEFLEMHGPEDDEDGEDEEMRALKPAARAFVLAGKTPRSRALRRGIAISRAGRELSVANKDKLEAAQDHHERALKHHREMHERTEAGAEHLANAQERCQRASQTLAEFGEHVRAAKEEPENAKEHLAKAEKAKGETEKHLEAADGHHDDAKDAHDDADDHHRAIGRRIKAAHRCVRTVLSGAVTSEADDTAADETEDTEKAKEEKARAARAARAAALQPRKEPVTLTLD